MPTENIKLPATIEVERRPAATPIAASGAQSRDTVPLSHYLWIFRRHGGKVVACVLGCMAITLVISLQLTPIYESTATVDVDRRMPTGIVGQEATQSTSNDADQFLATQVKTIQSDSVLRPVAEKFKLLERSEESGHTRAEDRALDAESPILLKKLRVTRPNNTYLLQISYRSRDRYLATEVANAIAQSYLEHTYEIRYKASAGLSRFMEKELEELRAKMERSGGALAKYEKELNIINPEEKTNILSARLLELNTAYTKAQADRVNKEAAFAAIQGGSMQAAHVSTQGEALRKLKEDYNAARQRFAEVRAHFGPNHPEYLLAAAQLTEVEQLLKTTAQEIGQRVEVEFGEARHREQMLKKELLATKAEFDRLNARSFEYQSLKREAEGDKKLYEELVRKIKEASINSSFQNNSVRISDPARPGRKPVFPNIPLNVFLAFLVSGLVAIGAAVVAEELDSTIRDPEQAVRALQVEVLGTLPQVKNWRSKLPPVSTAGNNGSASAVLAKSDDRGIATYAEAIRTLRNSILLTNFEGNLKTILVTSASPSEGKSTIAVHLAIAYAQQGQRTLIIDADLRRPSLHKRFAVANVVGLSNVLLEGTDWRQALCCGQCSRNLDVLPAGSASPREATEFIGSGLGRLLAEAYTGYDLVILDAPPLLGFPEPLQMAAAVDGVLIVARAGETSRKGVANLVATLHRIRSNVIGLVINEVHKRISDSYYYYGYYGRYYKHYNSNGKG